MEWQPSASWRTEGGGNGVGPGMTQTQHIHRVPHFHHYHINEQSHDNPAPLKIQYKGWSNSRLGDQMGEGERLQTQRKSNWCARSPVLPSPLHSPANRQQSTI